MSDKNYDSDGSWCFSTDAGDHSDISSISSDDYMLNPSLSTSSDEPLPPRTANPIPSISGDSDAGVMDIEMDDETDADADVDSDSSNTSTPLDETEDEVNGIDDEVNEIDNEVNGIDDEVNEIDNEVNGIDDEVNEIDDEVNGIDDEVNEIDDEVNEIDDLVNGIDDEVNEIDDEVNGIDDEVNEIDDEVNRIDDDVIVLSDSDDIPNPDSSTVNGPPDSRTVNAPPAMFSSFWKMSNYIEKEIVTPSCSSQSTGEKNFPSSSTNNILPPKQKTYKLCFENGIEVVKILGSILHKGLVLFRVRWQKDKNGGTDFIESRHMERICPRMTLQYYKQRNVKDGNTNKTDK